MKKQISIISSIMLILILSIVLAQSKTSFAIPEASGTMSIKCNKETLISTESATCTLTGSIENSEVNAISAKIDLSSNLQLENINPLNGWLGSSENGIIELYTDKTKSTSFDIVTFTVKANNVGSNETGKISINNIKYKDNSNVVDVTNVNKNISIIPKTLPTPTKSSNNNLKSLGLSNSSIQFNKDITNYQTTVNNNVSNVILTAAMEDSSANFVAGYGPRTIKLSVGNNTVFVKVQAENGNIKTYTININRKAKEQQKNNNQQTTNKNDTKKTTNNEKGKKSTEKSSDNSLKTLTLSKGNISFKSNVQDYNIEVPYTVTSLEINATPSNEKATIKGLGTKTINIGKNTFEIVVTAENSNTKTYTINIERKEATSQVLNSNNDLKSLLVKGHKIDFDKDTTNYEVEITSEKELSIKATPSSEKSEVSIIGNEDLKDGDEVKIIVTAEDGNNKIYTILVHAKSSNNILYTAIGIFVIGILSLLIAIKYKKNKETSY